MLCYYHCIWTKFKANRLLTYLSHGLFHQKNPPLVKLVFLSLKAFKNNSIA